MAETAEAARPASAVAHRRVEANGIANPNLLSIGQELPRCEVGDVKAYVERKPRKQVRRRRLL